MIRPPRVTIRLMLGLVFLCALILGLAIPAVEVYRTKEPHVHLGIDVRGTPRLAGWNGIQPPFWPRYLRRLTGRPWRRQPCEFNTGFEVDWCEFGHPEIVMRIGNRVAYQFDSAMEERLEAILREREATSSPTALP